MTAQQVSVQSFLVGVVVGASVAAAVGAFAMAAVVRLLRPRPEGHYLPQTVLEPRPTSDQVA